MRAPVIAITLGLFGVCGCSWSLGRDMAREILQKREIKDGVVECAWTAPRQAAKDAWAFNSFDESETACAGQLKDAGLVTLGGCLKEGCPGGCCSREILAAGKARFEAPDGGLKFRCGSIALAEINKITTGGDQAAVTYASQTELDEPFLARLPACRLGKPTAGRLTLERAMKRDSVTGTWDCLNCTH
jgi:hypothetical protein